MTEERSAGGYASGALAGVLFWAGAAVLFGLAIKVTSWSWIALAVWAALFAAYIAWLGRTIRRIDAQIQEGREP